MPKPPIKLDEAQQQAVLQVYDRVRAVQEFYWERLDPFRQALVETAMLAAELFSFVELEQGAMPPWFDAGGEAEPGLVPRPEAERITGALMDCVVDCGRLTRRLNNAVEPLGAWAGPKPVSGPRPDYAEVVVAIVAKLANVPMDAVQRVLDDKRTGVRDAGHLARRLRRANIPGHLPLRELVARQAGIDPNELAAALGHVEEVLEPSDSDDRDQAHCSPVDNVPDLDHGNPMAPRPSIWVQALARQLNRTEDEILVAIELARTSVKVAT